MGVSFLAQNPGKRSITLNLKHARGKEAFRKLVASADVLVENFRPGVMKRLGLGHEDLKAVNPRLIYCAISGFGQDGPLRTCLAYDQIIQGMSGVMSITGDPETAPYRVRLSGLRHHRRHHGGLRHRGVAGRTPTRTEGDFLDGSMLEATLATMGWVVSNHLIAGKAPSPMGNENMTASPSGTFRTGDGLLNIAANKQSSSRPCPRGGSS